MDILKINAPRSPRAQLFFTQNTSGVTTYLFHELEIAASLYGENNYNLGK